MHCEALYKLYANCRKLYACKMHVDRHVHLHAPVQSRLHVHTHLHLRMRVYTHMTLHIQVHLKMHMHLRMRALHLCGISGFAGSEGRLTEACKDAQQCSTIVRHFVAPPCHMLIGPHDH